MTRAATCGGSRRPQFEVLRVNEALPVTVRIFLDATKPWLMKCCSLHDRESAVRCPLALSLPFHPVEDSPGERLRLNDVCRCREFRIYRGSAGCHERDECLPISRSQRGDDARKPVFCRSSESPEFMKETSAVGLCHAALPQP